MQVPAVSHGPLHSFDEKESSYGLDASDREPDTPFPHPCPGSVASREAHLSDCQSTPYILKMSMKKSQYHLSMYKHVDCITNV